MSVSSFDSADFQQAPEENPENSALLASTIPKWSLPKHNYFHPKRANLQSAQKEREHKKQLLSGTNKSLLCAPTSPASGNGKNNDIANRPLFDTRTTQQSSSSNKKHNIIGEQNTDNHPHQQPQQESQNYLTIPNARTTAAAAVALRRMLVLNDKRQKMQQNQQSKNDKQETSAEEKSKPTSSSSHAANPSTKDDKREKQQAQIDIANYLISRKNRISDTFSCNHHSNNNNNKHNNNNNNDSSTFQHDVNDDTSNNNTNNNNNNNVDNLNPLWKEFIDQIFEKGISTVPAMYRLFSLSRVSVGKNAKKRKNNSESLENTRRSTNDEKTNHNNNKHHEHVPAASTNSEEDDEDDNDDDDDGDDDDDEEQEPAIVLNFREMIKNPSDLAIAAVIAKHCRDAPGGLVLDLGAAPSWPTVMSSAGETIVLNASQNATIREIRGDVPGRTACVVERHNKAALSLTDSIETLLQTINTNFAAEEELKKIEEEIRQEDRLARRQQWLLFQKKVHLVDAEKRARIKLLREEKDTIEDVAFQHRAHGLRAMNMAERREERWRELVEDLMDEYEEERAEIADQESVERNEVRAREFSERISTLRHLRKIHLLVEEERSAIQSDQYRIRKMIWRDHNVAWRELERSKSDDKEARLRKIEEEKRREAEAARQAEERERMIKERENRDEYFRKRIVDQEVGARRSMEVQEVAREWEAMMRDHHLGFAVAKEILEKRIAAQKRDEQYNREQRDVPRVTLKWNDNIPLNSSLQLLSSSSPGAAAAAASMRARNATASMMMFMSMNASTTAGGSGNGTLPNFTMAPMNWKGIPSYVCREHTNLNIRLPENPLLTAEQRDAKLEVMGGWIIVGVIPSKDTPKPFADPRRDDFVTILEEVANLESICAPKPSMVLTRRKSSIASSSARRSASLVKSRSDQKAKNSSNRPRPSSAPTNSSSDDDSTGTSNNTTTPTGRDRYPEFLRTENAVSKRRASLVAFAELAKKEFDDDAKKKREQQQQQQKKDGEDADPQQQQAQAPESSVNSNNTMTASSSKRVAGGRLVGFVGEDPSNNNKTSSKPTKKGVKISIEVPTTNKKDKPTISDAPSTEHEHDDEAEEKAKKYSGRRRVSFGRASLLEEGDETSNKPPQNDKRTNSPTLHETTVPLNDEEERTNDDEADEENEAFISSSTSLPSQTGSVTRSSRRQNSTVIRIVGTNIYEGNKIIATFEMTTAQTHPHGNNNNNNEVNNLSLTNAFGNGIGEDEPLDATLVPNSLYGPNGPLAALDTLAMSVRGGGGMGGRSVTASNLIFFNANNNNNQQQQPLLLDNGTEQQETNNPSNEDEGIINLYGNKDDDQIDPFGTSYSNTTAVQNGNSTTVTPQVSEKRSRGRAAGKEGSSSNKQGKKEGKETREALLANAGPLTTFPSGSRILLKIRLASDGACSADSVRRLLAAVAVGNKSLSGYDATLDQEATFRLQTEITLSFRERADATTTPLHILEQQEKTQAPLRLVSSSSSPASASSPPPALITVTRSAFRDVHLVFPLISSPVCRGERPVSFIEDGPPVKIFPQVAVLVRSLRASIAGGGGAGGFQKSMTSISNINNTATSPSFIARLPAATASGLQLGGTAVTGYEMYISVDVYDPGDRIIVHDDRAEMIVYSEGHNFGNNNNNNTNNFSINNNPISLMNHEDYSFLNMNGDGGSGTNNNNNNHNNSINLHDQSSDAVLPIHTASNRADVASLYHNSKRRNSYGEIVEEDDNENSSTNNNAKSDSFINNNNNNFNDESTNNNVEDDDDDAKSFSSSQNFGNNSQTTHPTQSGRNSLAGSRRGSIVNNSASSPLGRKQQQTNHSVNRRSSNAGLASKEMNSSRRSHHHPRRVTSHLNQQQSSFVVTAEGPLQGRYAGKFGREILVDEKCIATIFGPLCGGSEIKTTIASRMPSTIKFSDNATINHMKDVVERLKFIHTTLNPIEGDRNITVSVRSPQGELSSISRQVIVQPVDDATELHLNTDDACPAVFRYQADFSTTASPAQKAIVEKYLPPQAPAFVAPNAEVVDPDSEVFEGGFLEVEIVDGVTVGDLLYITENPREAYESFGKFYRQNNSGNNSKNNNNNKNNKKHHNNAEKNMQQSKTIKSKKEQTVLVVGDEEEESCIVSIGHVDEKTIDLAPYNPNLLRNRLSEGGDLFHSVADIGAPCLSIIVGGDRNNTFDNNDDDNNDLLESSNSSDSNNPFTSSNKNKTGINYNYNHNDDDDANNNAISAPLIQVEGDSDGDGDDHNNNDKKRKQNSTDNNNDDHHSPNNNSQLLGLSALLAPPTTMSGLGASRKRVSFRQLKDDNVSDYRHGRAILRIELTKVTIEFLQTLVRSIAFKNTERTGGGRRGDRTVEFRLVAGDPYEDKPRKFDPFKPVTGRCVVRVAEPLIQAPASYVYKEGMGPMYFYNLALYGANAADKNRDDAVSARRGGATDKEKEEREQEQRGFGNGFISVKFLEGFCPEDRLYIRSLEDTGVSLHECLLQDRIPPEWKDVPEDDFILEQNNNNNNNNQNEASNTNTKKENDNNKNNNEEPQQQQSLRRKSSDLTSAPATVALLASNNNPMIPTNKNNNTGASISPDALCFARILCPTDDPFTRNLDVGANYARKKSQLIPGFPLEFILGENFKNVFYSFHHNNNNNSAHNNQGNSASSYNNIFSNSNYSSFGHGEEGGEDKNNNNNNSSGRSLLPKSYGSFSNNSGSSLFQQQIKPPQNNNVPMWILYAQQLQVTSLPQLQSRIALLPPTAKHTIARYFDVNGKDKSLIGILENNGTELRVQFRTHARRFLKSKLPASSTRAIASKDDTAAAAAASLKNQTNHVDTQTPQKFVDIKGIATSDVGNILRQLVFECRNVAKNTENVRRVLLISVNDGTGPATTHIPVEINIQRFDEVTEVRRVEGSKAQMDFRVGSQVASIPVFGDSYLFDMDTDEFNSGYVSVHLHQGMAEGDWLRAMTLDEQVSFRRSKINSLRKAIGAHGASVLSGGAFAVREDDPFFLFDEEMLLKSGPPVTSAVSTSTSLGNTHHNAAGGKAGGGGGGAAGGGANNNNNAGAGGGAGGGDAKAGNIETMSGPVYILIPDEDNGRFTHPALSEYYYKVADVQNHDDKDNKVTVEANNTDDKQNDKSSSNNQRIFSRATPARFSKHFIGTIKVSKNMNNQNIKLVIRMIDGDGVPKMTLLRTGALLRAIAYFNFTTKPLKVRSGQRSFHCKVNPGGGADDGKSKCTIAVWPGLLGVAETSLEKGGAAGFLLKASKTDEFPATCYPLSKAFVTNDLTFKQGCLVARAISGMDPWNETLELDGVSKPGATTATKSTQPSGGGAAGATATATATASGAGKSFVLKGDKLMTPKGLLCGTLLTLTHPENPACVVGYVVEFENSSRMSGHVVQNFLKTIMFKCLAPASVSSRRVFSVCLNEGQRHMTNSVEVSLDIDAGDRFFDLVYRPEKSSSSSSDNNNNNIASISSGILSQICSTVTRFNPTCRPFASCVAAAASSTIQGNCLLELEVNPFDGPTCIFASRVEPCTAPSLGNFNFASSISAYTSAATSFEFAQGKLYQHVPSGALYYGDALVGTVCPGNTNVVLPVFANKNENSEIQQQQSQNNNDNSSSSSNNNAKFMEQNMISQTWGMQGNPISQLAATVWFYNQHNQHQPGNDIETPQNSPLRLTSSATTSSTPQHHHHQNQNLFVGATSPSSGLGNATPGVDAKKIISCTTLLHPPLLKPEVTNLSLAALNPLSPSSPTNQRSGGTVLVLGSSTTSPGRGNNNNISFNNYNGDNNNNYNNGNYDGGSPGSSASPASNSNQPRENFIDITQPAKAIQIEFYAGAPIAALEKMIQSIVFVRTATSLSSQLQQNQQQQKGATPNVNQNNLLLPASLVDQFQLSTTSGSTEKVSNNANAAKNNSKNNAPSPPAIPEPPVSKTLVKLSVVPLAAAGFASTVRQQALIEYLNTSMFSLGSGFKAHPTIFSCNSWYGDEALFPSSCVNYIPQRMAFYWAPCNNNNNTQKSKNGRSSLPEIFVSLTLTKFGGFDLDYEPEVKRILQSGNNISSANDNNKQPQEGDGGNTNNNNVIINTKQNQKALDERREKLKRNSKRCALYRDGVHFATITQASERTPGNICNYAKKIVPVSDLPQWPGPDSPFDAFDNDDDNENDVGSDSKENNKNNMQSSSHDDSSSYPHRLCFFELEFPTAQDKKPKAAVMQRFLQALSVLNANPSDASGSSGAGAPSSSSSSPNQKVSFFPHHKIWVEAVLPATASMSRVSSGFTVDLFSSQAHSGQEISDMIRKMQKMMNPNAANENTNKTEDKNNNNNNVGGTTTSTFLKPTKPKSTLPSSTNTARSNLGRK